MTTFSTLADAIAAGYTRGSHIPHRGFVIRPVDASDAGEYGYAYAVGITTGDALGLGEHWGEHESTHDLTCRRFGHTESVWLERELNRVHQPGVFTVRFAADVWAAGVEAARAAIDEWLARSPKAAAAVAAHEAWREEVRVRQAAKAARRERERTAKLVASWGAQA